MSERDSEGFELDEDMLGEVSSSDDNQDYDRFLARVDRRRSTRARKRS